MIEARRYRAVARRMGVGEVARVLKVRPGKAQMLLRGKTHYLTPAFARKIEAAVSERTADWLRASPRWDGVATGQMPSELIRPLIENSIAWEGVFATEAMTGTPLRTLHRIARDSNGVGIDLADQIVTGLLGAIAWQENPVLRRWYFTSDCVTRHRNRC